MAFKRIARASMQDSVWIAALAALVASAAWGQPAWRPEKPVEIVLPTAVGGGNDNVARLMQKILHEHKLLATPVVVMNKSGGNQTLAAVYLNQHPGDPHYLLFGSTSLFTNQISGLAQLNYAELTPLALSYVDHSGFTVSASSSLKTMRDLVDRLKSDPDSIAVGIISRGGSSHLALAQAVRSGGVDPKKMRAVVFKTSAEAVTAMMGGHIHASVSSASGTLPQVQAGNIRYLAVAAPQRRSGALAHVPTLREQGFDATGLVIWRAIFGAKGLTQPQSAFWDDALSRTFAADEWKNYVEGNNLATLPLRGGQLTKYLEGEYTRTKAVMVDLGLAK
jgi:putative tricarboxylic transport membrane protein